jgi:uncharacterized membrane protein YoaK (UPF0700 family)
MVAVNKNITFGVCVLLYIVGISFVMVNYIFEMPYEKWLSENISGWISVMVCLFAGASFVIGAFPKRSLVSYYLIWIVICFGAVILKSTFNKALFVNTLIVILSGLAFIFVKDHYKRQEKKSSE